MKLVWFLFGLLLLPVCVAVTQGVWGFASGLPISSQTAGAAGTWAFISGFLLWLFLYAVLPRPVRTYVLAHELTHALWGKLMGAKVHRIRVGSKGGSAQLSKTNVLITLAPYFCPFYTLLALIAYPLANSFTDLHNYRLFWVGTVGLTWGFHIAFTFSTLAQEQPDIREYGAFFSYTVIYLFNVLVLSFLIVAITPLTAHALLSALATALAHTWELCCSSVLRIAHELTPR